MSGRKKISLTCFIVFSILFLFKCSTKLTYLEYSSVNGNDDICLDVNTTGEEIVQEFYMPYDFLHSISIKVRTYERDNNSVWLFRLTEGDTDKILYEKKFYGSLIEDNAYVSLKLDHNAYLQKGQQYRLHVIALSVTDMNSLGFYCAESTQSENTDLFVNGMRTDGMLCFRIYGGDIDYWWSGFGIFSVIFLFLIMLRFWRAKEKCIRIIDDKLLMSMLLMLIVFLLLSTFSVADLFMDENDNMRGGMIIAKGGVLYRDYVTQHTPVAYYICAVFALLGAGSAQQFRLSYYIMNAVIWGLLYYRHADRLGRKKLFALPILEHVLILAVLTSEGAQLLSDHIQGICMVILVLEALVYYQDRKMGWDRSLIVSLCVWGSFGSAFVSAYALACIIGMVCIIEWIDWKQNGFSKAALLKRYWKISIAISIPFICATVYFKWNQSLRRAFDQMYAFNTEVYSRYIGGFGGNKAEPLLGGIQFYFTTVSRNFNKMMASTATDREVLELTIILLATGAIIALARKKNFWTAIILFLSVCCNATRGYGFHALAAWYIIILIICLYMDEIFFYFPKAGKIAGGVMVILALSRFIPLVCNNLLYRQPPVSELESAAIAITEEGEEVFLDAIWHDSLYYMYKNRYPSNRALYMLPWYMDWYEQDAIDDLKNNKPRIVIYDKDKEVWGYQYWENAFLDELNRAYTRFSDKPYHPDENWVYSVWVRND